MDDRFDKLELKLDKLDLRLDDIDKTLIKQEINLSNHMRRTQLLEDRVEPLEEQSKFVKNVILFAKILAGTLTFLLGCMLALKELGII